MALLISRLISEEEDVVLPTVGMCQGSSLTKVQLKEANKAVVEALREHAADIRT